MPDDTIQNGLQELWKQLPQVVKDSADKAQAVLQADPSDKNGEAAAHAEYSAGLVRDLKNTTAAAIKTGQFKMGGPVGGVDAPVPTPAGSVTPPIAPPAPVPQAVASPMVPRVAPPAGLPTGAPVQPPIVVNVNNGHQGPLGEQGQEGPPAQIPASKPNAFQDSDETIAAKNLYNMMRVPKVQNDTNAPPDFLRFQSSLDKQNDAKNLSPMDSDALIAYANKYYPKNADVQKMVAQLNAVKFSNTQNASRARQAEIDATEGGENVSAGLPTDLPGAKTQYGDDYARPLLPGEIKAQQAQKVENPLAEKPEVETPITPEEKPTLSPEKQAARDAFQVSPRAENQPASKDLGNGWRLVDNPDPNAPPPKAPDVTKSSLEVLADNLQSNPKYQGDDGKFDPYKMVDDFSRRAHIDISQALAEWDSAHGDRPSPNIGTVIAAFFAGLSHNPEAMKIANQWHDDAQRWDDARNKFVEAMGGQSEQNVKLATEFANKVMETESRRQEAKTMREHADILEKARENARAAEHKLSLAQSAEFEKNRVAHEEDVQNRMDVREGQRLDQEYQRQQTALGAAESRNKENIAAKAAEHDKQIKATKEYQQLNYQQKVQYEKLLDDARNARIGVQEFNTGLRALRLLPLIF